jgi:hypothetical protein
MEETATILLFGAGDARIARDEECFLRHYHCHHSRPQGKL